MPTPKYEIKPTTPQRFWDQVAELPWNPVKDADGKVKCQLVKRRYGRSQIAPDCRGACPGGSRNCEVRISGRGNKIGAKCVCK